MTDSTTNEAAWLDWRRRREEDLKAPYGWLSQTGLYWLQMLGGFKARVPGIAGEWALRDGAVTFTPAAPAVLDGEGEPADAPVLVDAQGGRTSIAGPVHVPSDAEANGAYVEVGRIRASVIERSGRFGIRVRDPESEFRRDFTGIPAYDFDPAWRIAGRFEPYDEARATSVGTRVPGMSSTLDAVGEVSFTVQGAEQRLIAFDGGVAADGSRGLFIIFRDPTNGDTTYGSGRFLAATVTGGGVAADDVTVSDHGAPNVLLDFNRAYNPPCAFSPYCTCPLAPAGNEVSVPVTAGERH
ncbi:DUF1684 domain-containing protein [Bifidobacterium sp. MA2]|uniref:DUF1684 domain-containing protein n=1 Tax=Bifidobacterium santillanense TaxID=2809028 RepID=A0ABS5UNI1_9BIFI|nr:DUF1684 domain-containing protein [Bifidobacterium santillanense]MBT1172473.1 DUF1684 domain-containing protein [Bifidobacterium santillanense]